MNENDLLHFVREHIILRIPLFSVDDLWYDSYGVECL